MRRALEPAGQDERERHRAEHDEAESPVGDQQGDHRGRQQHEVRDERRHALREDVRDGVDVARQPRDDPARLLLREVAQREAGQMVEEVAPQPDHHALADAGEPADEDGLEDPADAGDDEVDDDDRRQVVLVAGADAVVDRVADEQPAAGLAGGVAGRDEHEQERDQPVALEVAPEPLHAATSSPKSAANAPPARSRSRGVPDSTIRPSRSTTARSASSTVESRCVATSTVRPCERGAQALDEPPLGERVDGRERVVEHDDAGVRDQRPRERDALALAARQVDAALADQRVVAVGQLVREGVDAGGLARREHLVPVGVLAAGGEVLAQRHREEHRPLRDERDGRAELRDRHVARVDAADEHAARRSGRRSGAAG